jgi:heme/copper-type cytochrome/quinol oxidase subunit 2
LLENGREPARGEGRTRSQLNTVAWSGVLSLAVIAFGSVMTALPLDVKPSGPEGLQAAENRFAQRSISSPPADPAPLHIRATGQQWLWRFDYPDEPDEPTPAFDEPGGFAQTFSYHTLVIPVDTTVILDVGSIDVVHTWWVPDLGPQVDAHGGQFHHDERIMRLGARRCRLRRPGGILAGTVLRRRGTGREEQEYCDKAKHTASGRMRSSDSEV